ncbi:hypothetical protein [Asticcacaulis solisilvae]|uniref:hypothetical protein n=1 Tax=Asticcacaulis solisilvae TaxID=1217274 RepID=UPI003FD6EF56
MHDDQKDDQKAPVNDNKGLANGSRHISQGDPEGRGTTLTSPTEMEDPQVRSGAGVDIDSDRMPADGILEVHDSDDDILEEEKHHPISDCGKSST